MVVVDEVEELDGAKACRGFEAPQPVGDGEGESEPRRRWVFGEADPRLEGDVPAGGVHDSFRDGEARALLAPLIGRQRWLRGASEGRELGLAKSACETRFLDDGPRLWSPVRHTCIVHIWPDLIPAIWGRSHTYLSPNPGLTGREQRDERCQVPGRR